MYMQATGLLLQHRRYSSGSGLSAQTVALPAPQLLAHGHEIVSLQREASAQALWHVALRIVVLHESWLSLASGQSFLNTSCLSLLEWQWTTVPWCYTCICLPAARPEMPPTNNPASAGAGFGSCQWQQQPATWHSGQPAAATAASKVASTRPCGSYSECFAFRHVSSEVPCSIDSSLEGHLLWDPAFIMPGLASRNL